MTGRLASGLLAVVVSVASLPIARGQPSAEQQRAAELVQRGIQLQTKHDIDGAVALYRQAYCMIPEPVLVYNIGTAYQEGGKPVEAMSYFRYYLKIAAGGDLVGDAKNAIKMLQQGGARGSETASIQCEAKPPACFDGSQPVNGKCKPVTPPPPTTCPDGQELRDGACVAVVTETKPPPPSAVPGPRRNKTLFYAGVGTAGAGVVALAVGIGFGIKAKNASDALTNNMGMWTPELLAKEQEGKDAERNQIIFTTVGGVAVAAGVVMVVLGLRTKGGAETSAFVPYVSGDDAGVAFTTRY